MGLSGLMSVDMAMAVKGNERMRKESKEKKRRLREKKEEGR
jgi:hypothetical protein